MGRGVRLALAFVLVGALFATGTLTTLWDEAVRYARMDRDEFVMVVSSSGEGVPSSDGEAYTFLMADTRGTPARWDPCRPVPVLVNLDGAPEHAERDLWLAVQRVASLSGAPLDWRGTTDLRPSDDYLEGSVPGYPDGPPVLVGWVPDTSPLLDGAAGRAYVRARNGRLAAGMIVLSSDTDGRLRPGFDHPRSSGILYLHELGHLVGLGHVDDPGQVMHVDGWQAPDLGAGDLAGLAALQTDACVR